MQTKRAFKVLALAAVVVAIVFGCTPAPPPVTIDERIADFITALNTDTRTGIQDNFHPSLTADVVSGAILTYDWTVPFPLVGTGTAYSQTNVDKTNSPTIIVTITGPAAFSPPKDLKLLMALEGTDDWRIQELSMNATSGNTTFASLIK
jgi:hypothetical protein